MAMSKTLMLMCFGIAAVAGADDGASTEARPLDEVLQCNSRAQGAAVLAGLEAVSYRLEITEPGFTVRGHYRATRDGRMRIDIYSGDVRVFSEGHDGKIAWTWPRGAAHSTEASPEGEAALRHGLQQPGHFHALEHMPANGHQVSLEGAEVVDGRVFDVVRVTLADGFRRWYWVARDSCLIERTRSFRAFHPDVDPTAVWMETRHAGFRRIGGVSRAMATEQVDLKTAEVLGTTRVLEYTPDPELDPEIFRAP